ncbi:MAG: phosphate signaling complex protein PhoU [Myxococcota bacterium]
MIRHSDSVIEALRKDVFRMGGLCEAILEKSLRSVLDRDAPLAESVAHDDLEIDQLDIDIDEGVLKALALQAPVAADLRVVLAIKMVATDLERVGDISRNIAKSAIRLAEREESQAFPPQLIPMSRDVQRILRLALDAFSRTDAELARDVLDQDDAIDDLQDEIVRDMLTELETQSQGASRDVDLIWIAKNLERVADHATNIAEQVILVAEARNVKHASKLAAANGPD